MDKDQPTVAETPKPETKEPTSSSPAAKPAGGLAVASLVLGIIAILCGWVAFLGFILGVTALVLGIVALKKKVEGKGMAVAGIVTGSLATLASIISSILLIMSLALIGSAANTAGKAATEATKQINAALTEYQQAQLAQINAKKDFKKGTTAKFDVFEVKANSVTRNFVPESEYSRAAAGKELIVVNVTVKNTSEDTEYFTSYDIKLSENGVANTRSYLASVDPEFEGGSMAPGAISTGNLVYEVNSGATDLKLQHEIYGYNPTTSKSVTLVYTLEI